MRATTMGEVEAAILARAPEHDIDPTLDRVADLLELLGEPHRAAPVVHLTGTNGKTTTARMVEAMLRATGLRTGLFTSPHLHSVTERIVVDGTPVDEERFVAAWEEVAPFVEAVDARHGHRLSFFEVLTAMAFAVFADAPVDAVVLEVGMGGRWDATNVADGQVAVVTPVAVDHTRWLGSTVHEIATEKAGIMKKGAVAVLAQQPLEAADVLLRRAVEVGASVAREGIEFAVASRRVAVGGQLLDITGTAGRYDEVFVPLHGEHQAHNAAVAVAAVEAFLGRSEPLDRAVVHDALAAVRSPGRLEVVRRSPTVVLDAAHNPAGAAATAAAVDDAFAFTRLIGVVAVLDDKDVAGILGALEPVLAEVVVSTAPSPRALPVDDLAAAAEDVFGPDRVTTVAELPDAVAAAVERAEAAGDLAGAGVLVTGSVTTVAAARALLGVVPPR